MNSIPRLEPAKQFVTRIILLNRFHAPDEEDYEEATHVLGSIHQGFPNGAVHDQVAYLMGAIIRKKPFAEANFRTAWDYVSDLLAHRDLDLDASLDESYDLAEYAWEWADTEELEANLAQWFRPRIHKGRQA